MNTHQPADSRVAVLADCDNVSPEILEHALRVVAQFGRVVLRRGYGNQPKLSEKSWQESLVRLAFTPCLQYTYAKGKITTNGTTTNSSGISVSQTSGGTSGVAVSSGSMSNSVSGNTTTTP